MTKKYVKDGKVAVLVSRGFGFGWSTWNRSCRDYFCMDRGLVQLAMREAKQEEVCEYLTHQGFDTPNMCTNGWNGIEVVWVPFGIRFTIQEYDGAEALLLATDLEMEA